MTFDLNRCESEPSGAFRTLPPNATGLERSCVQSTSHSTLKSSAASGVSQQAGFAKLLRLVPLCGTQPRSGAVRECAGESASRFGLNQKTLKKILHWQ